MSFQKKIGYFDNDNSRVILPRSLLIPKFPIFKKEKWIEIFKTPMNGIGTNFNETLLGFYIK